MISHSYSSHDSKYMRVLQLLQNATGRSMEDPNVSRRRRKGTRRAREENARSENMQAMLGVTKPVKQRHGSGRKQCNSLSFWSRQEFDCTYNMELSIQNLNKDCLTACVPRVGLVLLMLPVIATVPRSCFQSSYESSVFMTAHNSVSKSEGESAIPPSDESESYA